jgi:hypothetical protein
VRRGASWTADHQLQLTGAAVAGSVLVVLAAELSWLVGRPDGGCPVERPAGIQRSGVVAVVGKARTPAMASVAGPRPACGVHHPVPSSGVRRTSRPVSGRLMSSVSSVQPVRCPAVRCPAFWCPPVRRPPVRLVSRLLSAPVRPDASVSSRLGRWRCGPGRCGGQPAPQERVEVPVGVTRWSGWVDGRAGPDAGDAAGVTRWSVGVGGGPGPGWVRAAAALWAPGAACSVRWPQRPRGCRSWAGVGSTTVGGSRGA